MMRSRSETEAWLRHTLKVGDSMDGKRLKGLASDSGIKERTLYRASEAIGVVTLPGGFGKPRRWHLCPIPGKGGHVCLIKINGKQAKGGRDGGPGAVAKAEPTESKLKEARGTAELVIHPAANAALVIAEFGDHFGDFNVGEPAARLKDGMKDVSNNDLRSCEAMLYCQTHVLQAIFVDSLLQATKREWFSNSEAHMRVALKAQSQCRATLETLAQIKNPAVVFARQANIAQGPQQVNNNAMTPAGEPRTREKRNYAKRTIGRETA